jgi:hypothetical protein
VALGLTGALCTCTQLPNLELEITAADAEAAKFLAQHVVAEEGSEEGSAPLGKEDEARPALPAIGEVIQGFWKRASAAEEEVQSFVETVLAKAQLRYGAARRGCMLLYGAMLEVAALFCSHAYRSGLEERELGRAVRVIRDLLSDTVALRESTQALERQELPGRPGFVRSVAMHTQLRLSKRPWEVLVRKFFPSTHPSHEFELPYHLFFQTIAAYVFAANTGRHLTTS